MVCDGCVKKEIFRIFAVFVIGAGALLYLPARVPIVVRYFGILEPPAVVSPVSVPEKPTLTETALPSPGWDPSLQALPPGVTRP